MIVTGIAGRGLKRWIRLWDSEQLIWSIETSTFHLNASYYHLIDEVTLTDNRYSHMAFLTKLTDWCVMTSGLQVWP